MGRSRAFDGPSLWRDLASLFSAWRLGLWFCAINGVLGVTLAWMVGMAASGSEPELSAIVDAIGLGQFLGCGLLLGLGGLITLLVPLRATGVFEGPRMGRYFDQLVQTGIPPMRYFGGKLAAQNLFFALLVVASLPYAIFSLGLGGTRMAMVLRGLLSLWVYVNVLSLMTLALATLMHEAIALLWVYVLFGGGYIVALMPLPPICGLLTPAHLLIEPIWEAMVGLVGGPPGWTINALDLGGISVGNLTVYLAGSLLLGSLAWGALLVGPVSCLVEATSAFGEVIASGSGRIRGRMTQRVLRRRSELAFFYENRPEWVGRWEAPLRVVGTSLVLGSLVAAGGALVGHGAGFGMGPADLYALTVGVAAGLLAVGTVVLAVDRTTWATPQAWGQRSWPMAQLQLGLFIGLWAVVLGGMAWAVGTQWSGGSGPFGNSSGAWLHAEVARQRARPLVLLLGLLAIQLYAMVTWLGLRSWSTGAAVLSAVAFVSAMWIVPFMFGVMLLEGLDYDPTYAGQASLVGCLSPIPALVHGLGGGGRIPATILRLGGGLAMSYAVQVLLTVILAILCARAYGWARTELEAQRVRPAEPGVEEAIV